MAPNVMQQPRARKGSGRPSQSTKTRNFSTSRRRSLRESKDLTPWSGWKHDKSGYSNKEKYEQDALDAHENSKPVRKGSDVHVGAAASGKSAADNLKQSVAQVPGKPRRAHENLAVGSKGGYSASRRNHDIQARIINDLSEDSDDAEPASATNVDTEKTQQSGQVSICPIVVSEPIDIRSSINTRSAHPTSTPDTQSEEDRIALAGPRCPLCICPINGVYFPIIQCIDCDRTYHMRCIGYRRHPEYHPFRRSGIPDAQRCDGCGCPRGEAFGIYDGHPSVWYHRRDQNPGFREYLRQGRLEEAKFEDLV